MNLSVRFFNKAPGENPTGKNIRVIRENIRDDELCCLEKRFVLFVKFVFEIPPPPKNRVRKFITSVLALTAGTASATKKVFVLQYYSFQSRGESRRTSDSKSL